MFKDFLIRKMMKKHLAGVPEEQQEMLVKAVSENPELFQKIAVEMQEKVKGGQDQMSAAMEVMGKYKEELQGIIKK